MSLYTFPVVLSVTVQPPLFCVSPTKPLLLNLIVLISYSSSLTVSLSIIPFSIDMSGIGYAFIPLLNIVSSMNLLIKETSMALLVPYLAVTVVINLVISGVLVFITAKMFNSEQVMFQR